MNSRQIANVLVDAGCIQPGSEENTIAKLDEYGFVDDELKECREVNSELLASLKELCLATGEAYTLMYEGLSVTAPVWANIYNTCLKATGVIYKAEGRD